MKSEFFQFCSKFLPVEELVETLNHIVNVRLKNKNHVSFLCQMYSNFTLCSLPHVAQFVFENGENKLIAARTELAELERCQQNNIQKGYPPDQHIQDQIECVEHLIELLENQEKKEK